MNITLELYKHDKYDKIRNSTKDIYAILLARYKASKRRVSKGSQDFVDDLGVFCYYSQKDLANKIKKSERTVRYAFRILKDAGLITVVERGSQQIAKIYVNDIFDKEAKQTVIEIENDDIKTVFEETFYESANTKEAIKINDMTKTYDLTVLVEAIKKSCNVKWKKARISYIKRVYDSLIEQQTKPLKSTKKRIIREELVPNWLKSREHDKNNSENKQLTREDYEKIERMKQLQRQILGCK